MVPGGGPGHRQPLDRPAPDDAGVPAVVLPRRQTRVGGRPRGRLAGGLPGGPGRPGRPLRTRRTADVEIGLGRRPPGRRRTDRAGVEDTWRRAFIVSWDAVILRIRGPVRP